MKKILRKVSIKKWVAYCHTCDTQFEYESEDIHYNKFINHMTVSCPSCNSEILHNNNRPHSNITIETL